ncbi:MAG: response regulator [Opitutae bacterium]|nr:response regulator [Opitutae bacterium]
MLRKESGYVHDCRLPSKQLKIVGLILLIGWATSIWIYSYIRHHAIELDEIHFNELVTESESAISSRFNSYVDLLRGAASYYVSSNGVTREEWRIYVDSLKIQQIYPGINGIGFCLPFTSIEQHQQFQQKIESESLQSQPVVNVPDVTAPENDDPLLKHLIITHIEPLEINLSALGLQLSTETGRLHAALSARNSGEPKITTRIILIQDGEARPGFLLYVPAYKPGHPITTPEQRKQALLSFAYAPFITELFVAGVLGDVNPEQINFSVYDSDSISLDALVYSNMTNREAKSPFDFDQVRTLDIGGQIFTTTWQRGSEYKGGSLYTANVAGVLSALFTCLLAFAAYSYESLIRSKKIIESTTDELTATNQLLKSEIYVRKTAEAEAIRSELAAKTANEAKSDFLAIMSHEIRTPMNSVIGFTQLLYSSKLTSEQHIWASYIQSSSRALLSLINDILDFSKIEADKMELENIPFSLQEVIENVTGSFFIQAAEKGIIVNTKVEGDLPEYVLGDPTRLKQIVVNLVSNGLKFTVKGSVSIHLEWIGNKETGTVRIRVADTGIGIAPDKVDDLFRQFTQADLSTTRTYGGTGLGLSICQRLTGLMNGTIHATSPTSQGTTMVVEIPFSVSKEVSNTRIQEFTPIDANKSTESLAKILLVDDNDLNQQLGLTILEQMGYDVTLANNGAEAIELTKQTYYPIIFMDCRMPIMDGFDATLEIRKLEAADLLTQDAHNQRITIIALTANTSSADKEMCLRAGMDDYICKPYQALDFQKALNTYLYQS